MRSFIAALLIFIIICIMIAINTVYVTSVIEKLLLMCDDLRENSSAAAAENLRTEWQSCKDIIALSVHRADLERAENAVTALCAYTGSTSDFEYHLSLLEAALNHIAEAQRLTPDSIF